MSRMKFIKLTDSSQIKIRNKTTLEENHKKAMMQLSNFYVISDENREGLVRIINDRVNYYFEPGNDSETLKLGEVLLLNKKNKRVWNKRI